MSSRRRKPVVDSSAASDSEQSNTESALSSSSSSSEDEDAPTNIVAENTDTDTDVPEEVGTVIPSPLASDDEVDNEVVINNDDATASDDDDDNVPIVDVTNANSDTDDEVAARATGGSPDSDAERDNKAWPNSDTDEEIAQRAAAEKHEDKNSSESDDASSDSGSDSDPDTETGAAAQETVNTDTEVEVEPKPTKSKRNTSSSSSSSSSSEDDNVPVPVPARAPVPPKLDEPIKRNPFATSHYINDNDYSTCTYTDCNRPAYNHVTCLKHATGRPLCNVDGCDDTVCDDTSDVCGRHARNMTTCVDCDKQTEFEPGRDLNDTYCDDCTRPSMHHVDSLINAPPPRPPASSLVYTVPNELILAQETHIPMYPINLHMLDTCDSFSLNLGTQQGKDDLVCIFYSRPLTTNLLAAARRQPPYYVALLKLAYLCNPSNKNVSTDAFNHDWQSMLTLDVFSRTTRTAVSRIVGRHSVITAPALAITYERSEAHIIIATVDGASEVQQVSCCINKYPAVVSAAELETILEANIPYPHVFPAICAIKSSHELLRIMRCSLYAPWFEVETDGERRIIDMVGTYDRNKFSWLLNPDQVAPVLKIRLSRNDLVLFGEALLLTLDIPLIEAYTKHGLLVLPRQNIISMYSITYPYFMEYISSMINMDRTLATATLAYMHPTIDFDALRTRVYSFLALHMYQNGNRKDRRGYMHKAVIALRDHNVTMQL